jgi:FkbM family methyltransferase
MLLKQIGKLFFDRRRYYFYYYLLRFQLLGKAKRGEKRLMRFPGMKLWTYDPLSVLWQYKEIVLENGYHLDSLSPEVVILDCGANVGMSIVQFAHRFPKNPILAFEANPQIAELLKTNLLINNISSCEVVEKAVWIHSEGVEMSITPDDASSTSIKGLQTQLIPSVDFNEILQNLKAPAIMKMDIEGAEMNVLPHCSGSMQKLQHIFMEYHAYYNQPQDMDILLKTLSANGFRYTISRSYIFNDTSQPVEFVVNLLAKK